MGCTGSIHSCDDRSDIIQVKRMNEKEQYVPFASIRGPVQDRKLWERWVKMLKSKKIRVWDRLRQWIEKDMEGYK